MILLSTKIKLSLTTNIGRKESGGIVALILSPSAMWSLVDNFTSRPIYLGVNLR